MADSTARKNYQFMNEAIPEFEPKKVRVQAPRRQVVLNPKRVPYSRVEKTLLTVGCVLTFALMFVLVTFSIGATNAQRQLQTVNTAVVTKRGHNSDLEQEKGELTSTERMNKIAKQQGLQLIESNIRTVQK
ncbi:hypothetical protein FC62_GL000323 [Amylolactobacillus amylotrophicus DSM 20534]|uniref:Cell division protein FtsL n=4 Tax=Amylolactobacillus TaxID=2767876 RepID=A0A0R1YKG6_9LACO|nr:MULTISPECIES: cell division protein FtsL [Amylolactobacillus]APT19098.1 cell division protein FtsL [Amylolactobacillus amylophilus DSM 20533 = JCM 1125]KRK38636.1 hypothetical protein FC62_GL000323 [Amylolactobacillus amylotrophicus DSM 20534]KRM42721.1 hypothetical protein FD40_GL000516 [Amylolactobacillus amylophilus DSM 20533 = JCM 1125]GED79583.1 hypothetical protein LAM01_00560 [Amylolactobacillus amylophilus]